MNIGQIVNSTVKKYLTKKSEKLYFPGTGTSKIAKNIDVDVLNFKKLLKYIKFYKIKLVIVGPEEPLVKGLIF